MSDKNFVNEIINFIKKRNFVYERATNAIAQKIDFVFEAIIEYLDENAHEIEWESLDINNNLLIIVARIPFRSLYNEQKIVTIGIPLNVIQHQSKDKIIEFFVEAEIKQKIKQQEYMEAVDAISDFDVDFGYNDLDVDFSEKEDENNPLKKREIFPKRTLH